MQKKVLLAFDGSKNSLEAAKKAISFVKTNANSTLEVVYVVSPSQTKNDVLTKGHDFSIELARKGKVREAKELAEHEGIPYEVTILRGEPADTINKHIKEHQIDLLVIGSRGLSPLKKILLGSVSYQLAKKAKCDVFIVKNH